MKPVTNILQKHSMFKRIAVLDGYLATPMTQQFYAKFSFEHKFKYFISEKEWQDALAENHTVEICDYRKKPQQYYHTFYSCQIDEMDALMFLRQTGFYKAYVFAEALSLECQCLPECRHRLIYHNSNVSLAVAMKETVLKYLKNRKDSVSYRLVTAVPFDENKNAFQEYVELKITVVQNGRLYVEVKKQNYTTRSGLPNLVIAKTEKKIDIEQTVYQFPTIKHYINTELDLFSRTITQYYLEK